MRAWATSVAIFFATGSPRAEEIVRFRVEYSAPAGCPRARDFTAGVTGRTERARIAKGSDTVLVDVRVQSAEDMEEKSISPVPIGTRWSAP